MIFWWYWHPSFFELQLLKSTRDLYVRKELKPSQAAEAILYIYVIIWWYQSFLAQASFNALLASSLSAGSFACFLLLEGLLFGDGFSVGPWASGCGVSSSLHTSGCGSLGAAPSLGFLPLPLPLPFGFDATSETSCSPAGSAPFPRALLRKASFTLEATQSLFIFPHT